MPIKFFVKKAGSLFNTPYIDDFEDGVGDWDGNATGVFSETPWNSNVLRMGYNQTTSWAYALSGDFDIQIKTYVRSGINQRQLLLGVQKTSEDSTFIDAFTVAGRDDPDAYIVAGYTNGTPDTTVVSGTILRENILRITRVGNLFTGYRWNTSVWSEIGSKTLTNLSEESVQVRLKDIGSVNGDFDDFTVTSGTIVVK